MFFRGITGSQCCAVVKFSSTATVLADMTVIVDETTRDTLVNVLPTTVGGGTGIGAGMLKCGEVS